VLGAHHRLFEIEKSFRMSSTTWPPDVTACGSEAVSTPSEGRGVVVSATQVADLGPAEVAAVLHAAKFDPAPVRNGVTAYRVVYRTVGTGGGPTTASQLVALPKNDTSDLSVVSWLHGTTVYRGDVASVKDTSSDRAAALLFASTGRLARHRSSDTRNHTGVRP
jgi:hypothetical protein